MYKNVKKGKIYLNKNAIVVHMVSKLKTFNSKQTILRIA